MVSSRGGNDSTEEGATGVDELLDSLGLNEADEIAGWRATAVPPTSDVADGPDIPGITDSHDVAAGRPLTEETKESKDPMPLAAILGGAGLVLLLAVLSTIWLTRSSDSGDVATTTEASAAPSTALPASEGSGDLDAMAAEVQDSMDRLGFDGVNVEVVDGAVLVSGTVSSDQDLSAIRSAVLSASDPSRIDISAVEVAAAAAPAGQQALPPPPQGGEGFRPPPGGPPPGAPPPGFVAPTPEQRANLQGELNRVLTDTPLVFSPGSTELNELQLKVLDTVIIGLLEAHPGVPVRLVGYTDESGTDYANALLSIDRANAVRDYLIARGVPPFILRAEGRGEENTTGDSGADRRVEIEVIDGP